MNSVALTPSRHSRFRYRRQGACSSSSANVNTAHGAAIARNRAILIRRFARSGSCIPPTRVRPSFPCGAPFGRMVASWRPSGASATIAVGPKSFPLSPVGPKRDCVSLRRGGKARRSDLRECLGGSCRFSSLGRSGGRHNRTGRDHRTIRGHGRKKRMSAEPQEDFWRKLPTNNFLRGQHQLA